MTPVSFHLLIAADDVALRETLLDAMNTAGFNTEPVAGRSEALEAVRRRPFDLVVVSLGPALTDTLEVCSRLRDLSPDLGIVVVRHEITGSEEMLALDAGADDCVSAPFRFRELIARLGAILRKTRSGLVPPTGLIRAGHIELDPQQRMLSARGNEVHLSHREFDLLLFLMQNPGEVLTHVKVLRAVWGPEAGHDPRYLRSYIKALRRKIEIDPSRPKYILTVPWVGYRFHNPDQD